MMQLGENSLGLRYFLTVLGGERITPVRLDLQLWPIDIKQLSSLSEGEQLTFIPALQGGFNDLPSANILFKYCG